MATALQTAERRDVGRSPEACAAARRWVREVTQAWQCPDDQAADVALVLTELAANAMQHALPPCRAVLELRDDRTVVVTVLDGGPAPTALPQRDADEHGRGLTLVGGLSTDSGRRSAAPPFRVGAYAAVPVPAALMADVRSR
ncbi:ATP-binding protein [Streptomyces niveus]|uniref:ATP-binding protein n=1 Tax=Streptomyces niveus TaxID=193462 RepID=UPI0036C846C1